MGQGSIAVGLGGVGHVGVGVDGGGWWLAVCTCVCTYVGVCVA